MYLIMMLNWLNCILRLSNAIDLWRTSSYINFRCSAKNIFCLLRCFAAGCYSKHFEYRCFAHIFRTVNCVQTRVLHACVKFGVLCKCIDTGLLHQHSFWTWKTPFQMRVILMLTCWPLLDYSYIHRYLYIILYFITVKW